nr:MAG TPA: hypothetical protein [Caudoviricetes sp.]
MGFLFEQKLDAENRQDFARPLLSYYSPCEICWFLIFFNVFNKIAKLEYQKFARNSLMKIRLCKFCLIFRLKSITILAPFKTRRNP